MTNDLHKHELEAERKYGELRTRIEGLKVKVANNSKLLWFILSSILAFELNQIFNLVEM